MTIITINDEEEVGELIERYGKRTVKALCYDNLIQYDVSDEYLLDFGFNKKILSIVRGHVKRGKMLMHLNKKTGKVKLNFYGYSLHSTIQEIELEQLPENKAILKRLYDRFYEAYVVRYKKKFEGVDLKTDPITCDDIVNPAYIKADWDNNCKIVYSMNTILECYARKRVHVGFDTNEDGVDIQYYKEYPLDHYISPYTKNKFYISDVRPVKMKFLEN